MQSWTRKVATVGVFSAAAISLAQGSVTRTPRVGALEYVEGTAYVNGQLVSGAKDNLPTLDNGGTLRTANGHAEMILTPGVFLRLDAQSQIRLENASLTDTRVRLDQGAAIMEVDDLHKDNLIRVDTGQGTVRVLKTGLYRFNANPADVEVLKGKVEALEGDQAKTAGKHKEIAFTSGLAVNKFEPAADDDLSRWSRLRSEYEAEASVGSAQYVYDMGWPWGFSNWFWNPWFDTWTFLPAGGFWLNPYGFGYFSPFVVYSYFPGRYYGGFHHYAFTPHAGFTSPSGLNLQRGSAIRAARGGFARGGFRGAAFPAGGMHAMGGFGGHSGGRK